MRPIFLMRHCEAESGEQMDPNRQLTATGHEQAATMGAFLARQIGTCDVVVCSPFARAEVTAHIMAHALGCRVVLNTPALDPDSTADRAWAEIGRREGNVLVVSHHPLVGNLLEYLTHAKTDEVAFGHGHVAKVVGDRVHWFVGPHLVARDESIIEAAIRLADAVLEETKGDELQPLK